MKDTKEKKEIEEDIFFSKSTDIFSGSLQDVANNILSIENELKTQHQEIINDPNKYLYFKMRLDYTTYYDVAEIQLSGVRMETDAEYDKRIEHIRKSKEGKIAGAKKRKENKEKEELKTLKRLQEKYKDKL